MDKQKSASVRLTERVLEFVRTCPQTQLVEFGILIFGSGDQDVREIQREIFGKEMPHESEEF